jgi:hypothetical protein
MDFLIWLESTSIGTFVRESPSLWAYPTVLFLHSIGLASLVGINTAVDLRVLGVAPSIPLKPFGRLIPLMWIGFAVNLISGILLMLASASTLMRNPTFYVKMVFVTLGVIGIWLLDKHVFSKSFHGDRDLVTRDKVLAAASLFCWVGAIVSGRLIAYLGPEAGLPF